MESIISSIRPIATTTSFPERPHDTTDQEQLQPDMVRWRVGTCSALYKSSSQLITSKQRTPASIPLVYHIHYALFSWFCSNSPCYLGNSLTHGSAQGNEDLTGQARHGVQCRRYCKYKVVARLVEHLCQVRLFFCWCISVLIPI